MQRSSPCALGQRASAIAAGSSAASVQHAQARTSAWAQVDQVRAGNPLGQDPGWAGFEGIKSMSRRAASQLVGLRDCGQLYCCGLRAACACEHCGWCGCCTPSCSRWKNL